MEITRYVSRDDLEDFHVRDLGVRKLIWNSANKPEMRGLSNDQNIPIKITIPKEGDDE